MNPSNNRFSITRTASKSSSQSVFSLGGIILAMLAAFPLQAQERKTPPPLLLASQTQGEPGAPIWLSNSTVLLPTYAFSKEEEAIMDEVVLSRKDPKYYFHFYENRTPSARGKFLFLVTSGKNLGKGKVVGASEGDYPVLCGWREGVGWRGMLLSTKTPPTIGKVRTDIDVFPNPDDFAAFVSSVMGLETGRGNNVSQSGTYNTGKAQNRGTSTGQQMALIKGGRLFKIKGVYRTILAPIKGKASPIGRYSRIEIGTIGYLYIVVQPVKPKDREIIPKFQVRYLNGEAVGYPHAIAYAEDFRQVRMPAGSIIHPILGELQDQNSVKVFMEFVSGRMFTENNDVLLIFKGNYSSLQGLYLMTNDIAVPLPSK